VLFHSAIYEDAQEDISERIDETLESARELAERISVSRIEVPCFVASVSGDEALMHLGSIDWFLNAMWGSLRLLIFLLLGGAIAFLFRSASGWEGPFELAPSEALVLLGVAVALFGPVLIASVSRIIRGSPVGYGQEPLVAGPVRIIPSATPAFSLPGGSRLRRYRRPILGSRLRHCRLYDDREVIRDLCTWLRADDRNGAPIDAPITGSTRKSWVIASFAAILIGALGCFALPYGVEGDSVEDAELPLLPPIANQCRLSEAQWDKLCADARLRTQVRPPCPPCSGRPKPSDAHRRNRV
jgi:hypothetical protein